MRLSESYPDPNEKIAGPFSAKVQTLCAALDEMQKLLALSYSRDEMDCHCNIKPSIKALPKSAKTFCGYTKVRTRT